MAAPHLLPDEVQGNYRCRVHGFFGSNLLLADVDDGLAFHTARPVTHPPRTQAENVALEAEIEERLRLATAFVKRMKSQAEVLDKVLEGADEIKNFQLNVTHIAYIMFADLDMPREFSEMSNLAVGAAFGSIRNCEGLLARCMYSYPTPLPI